MHQIISKRRVRLMFTETGAERELPILDLKDFSLSTLFAVTLKTQNYYNWSSISCEPDLRFSDQYYVIYV